MCSGHVQIPRGVINPILGMAVRRRKRFAMREASQSASFMKKLRSNLSGRWISRVEVNLFVTTEIVRHGLQHCPHGESSIRHKMCNLGVGDMR